METNYFHSRELSDHLLNEIARNVVQVLENLKVTLHHISLMVGYVPLLAETIDKLVALWQIVTRNSGEQVVVYLVLKPSAKPVNKDLWNSMSSSNISCGSNLQLPEVRSCFSVIC